jgi:DNA-binding NarL/FixJ family response regulator
MINILLADDHPYLRRGVVQILTDEFPGAVIGEASNVPELLEQAQKQRWDVVVLDLNMPGRGGLEALHELKRLFPSIPVLVLSMHPEDQFAVRVLRAGVPDEGKCSAGIG